ncbi:MAG: ADP-ribosylation factor-like protein [Candidatus Korarchaeota archaeon]|nr:ADP-ribosylation factor-like protein [Thermoproteota archaeon]
MVIRAIAAFDSFGNELFYEAYASFTPNFQLLSRILLGMREHLPKEYDTVNMGQYKIALTISSDLVLLILADRVNGDQELEKVVQFLHESAREIFSGSAKTQEDQIEKFREKTYEAIAMLPVKCTLTGYGGVGKTTIVRLVARGERLTKHIPTILADVEEIKIEGIDPYKVTLFTVAGQPQYWRTWMLTTEGSDFVMLVTDSTYEDVERLQKEIIPYLMKITPYSRFIIIANKQDLPNALPPSVIEETCGIPSFPLVAIRDDAKEKFVEILATMIRELP